MTLGGEGDRATGRGHPEKPSRQEVAMAKEIGARWKPMWVTHLGCIKGCIEYLGLDVSDAWLFGATGHAFVINVHEVVCPSGPTAWNTEMLPVLGKNVGYTIDMMVAFKSQADFAKKRKLVWESIRRAIDQGLPCYGWELEIPEFYVVYGYDDVGYYYSGAQCDEGKGPKGWQELGESEIGVLEMYTVRPGQAEDDITTVKEALTFALEHSKSPARWTYPKYKAGLAGFDLWIGALETGTADGFGMAYNAAVWGECRRYAVQFLSEAKERIGGHVGALLDEAAAHYETIALSLEKVQETFPFPPQGKEIEDAERCAAAIERLRKAREAEGAGLRALETIVGAL